MKTSTLKSFLDLHTWTGLGAGLALFIAFYTGALTVFTHELHHWDRFDGSAPTAQSLEHAQRLLDNVLATAPEEATDRLRLELQGHWYPANQVRWFERKEDGSFEPHEYRLGDDGAIDTRLDTSHLAGFIYRLHYTAGLPASFGLYVLGVICVIYGMALVSGVVIFLPNFFRDLFVVRGGHNKKRFWLDTHNVVGMLSLPWHIMFAWSSAILAIGIFLLAPFQVLVFQEDLTAKLGPELGVVEHPEPSGETVRMLPIAQLLAIAESQAPGMNPSQLRFHHVGDSNAMVEIRGPANTRTLLSSAAVTLNAATGEVHSIGHPHSASAGTQFYRGLIELHFATFGGYTLKWVYFALGLAGAFLFYSGNLLFIESRRKRRQGEQTRGTMFLARLNSGVCIGCMAGVSAAFLASRAFTGFESRPDLTEYAYFGVFFLSIAWCFGRPVAAASRDLLYLTAILTLAIPLFDSVFVGLPFWRAAFSGDLALLVTDVLAFCGAIAFWAMARGLQARAVDGDANSVWAHPRGQSPGGTRAGVEFSS